jgi:hypothetical protein
MDAKVAKIFIRPLAERAWRRKEGTSAVASGIPASPEMAAKILKATYPNLPCRAPKEESINHLKQALSQFAKVVLGLPLPTGIPVGSLFVTIYRR